MKKTTQVILFCLIAAICAIVITLILNGREAPALPVQPENPTPPVTQTTPCLLTATGTVTILNRPDQSADVFGTLAQGDTQQLSGITSNGWYAFEPGVAQAGNIVSLFRNRYIAPAGAYTVTGSCESLPKLAALPANICFEMVGNDTPVYTSPSISSKLITTLHAGDYLEAVATHDLSSSDYSKYFVEVNSKAGSVPSGIDGWISGTNVNFNGHCGGTDIPTK